MNNAVGILCAAVVAAAAFAAPSGALAQASSVCASSVQGKIAIDGKQNRTWSDASLNALCKGAENSTEPGVCYQRVMTSGAVNWGGGATWQPANALRLCAGATNAAQRIDCFSSGVAQGKPWAEAIAACAGGQSAAAPKAIAPPVVAPPVAASPKAGAIAPAPAGAPSAPASSSLTPEEINRAIELVRANPSSFTCVGPLRVDVRNYDPRTEPGKYELMVYFEGATSSRDIRPGQCWRSAGFDFPTALGAGRTGRINYVTELGPCGLVRSAEMRDGRLAMIDSPDMFAGLLLGFGAGPGSRAPFPTVFQFGPNPGLAVAQYTVKLEVLSAHKPAYCE